MSKSSVAIVVAVAAASSSCGAYGALCSQAQVAEGTALVTTNKAVFQSCLADIKLPSSTSVDAWTSFISDEYLQDVNADAVCASDNCVKALIAAMEKLPDCCVSSGSNVRNIPRLADDILHQCDVRDARKLALELEAEIAKLPDLKVQIKSLGAATNGSSSGDGNGTAAGDGVDVIIDVKKRELMKAGVGISPNDTESQSIGNGNAAIAVRALHAAAVGLSLVVAALIM